MQPTRADNLKTKNAALKEITRAVLEMDALSDAFAATGNDKMSLVLDDLATRIADASEQLRLACDGMFIELLGATQSSSLNLIGACLAGMAAPRLPAQHGEPQK